MPDRPPSEFDSESDWTGYCVPFMMDEGMPQKQAVAACLQMWRDRDKALSDRVEKAYGMLHRAYSRFDVKTIEDERRIIKGIASTPTVDRIGDIVEPLGAQFDIPMALMLDHHHNDQVGHVYFARPIKDGIPFEASIVKFDEPGEVKNLVDKAWHLVKTRLRSFVSIGFRSLEDGVELLENGGRRFKRWEWVELSLVAVPANREAVIFEAKSLDAAIREIKALNLAASGHSTSRPGATGKIRTNPNPVKLKERRAMNTETVSERIGALEAKRAANLARMNAMSDEAGKKGETLDESGADEYDGLEREIDTIDKQLERERKLERFNLSKAVPVSQVRTVDDGAAVRGNGPIRVIGPRAEPGIRFARMAKALCMAQGNREGAARIAEQLWGDDTQLVNVMKAGVMAGTTVDSVYAGPLVTASTGEAGGPVADFAEYLRPMTVLGKFGTNGIPSLNRVPFRVGLLGETAGGEGYWVGEGQPKPVTSTAFSRTTLLPLKVANIAVITEELARDSSPSAEVQVRNTLAAALIAKLDTDFLDPAKAAVADISPASITNGVTPVASSGITVAAVAADVAAIMAPFIAANNIPSSGVWIMSTTTALSLSLMLTSLGNPAYPSISMMGGTFAGLPVIVSDYVPGGGGSPGSRMVILVNATDIYLGDDGGVRVDMSREASLEMSTTPTNAVTGQGGSPLGVPVATTLTSLWQTDSIGLRAERVINWKKRRASAVQMLSNVVWGT